MDDERTQRQAIEEEVKSLKSFLSELCKNIDDEGTVPDQEQDEDQQEDKTQEEKDDANNEENL